MRLTCRAFAFGLVLYAAFYPLPLAAFGDRKVHCGNLTEGDVVLSSIKIVCGMSAEEFADNMRLALSSMPGDKQELFRRLDRLTPEGAKLQAGAIDRFFEILGKRELPVERLQDTFVEIATRHIELLDEIRRFRVHDPDVQTLRDAAEGALKADRPDLDAAQSRLEEARQLVRTKRETAEKLLADQKRAEAQIVREQAHLEYTRIRFAGAAELFEEAASLWPDDDRAQQAADLENAGRSYYQEGVDFGDIRFLERAVVIYRGVLEQKSRDRAPLDWASTQNNLGAVLSILGGREVGTDRLAQAVDAYRLALEEWTRDRVPFDWATTQNNLGNALSSLGERERGTQYLEQAVDAYRLALEERSRDRVPLYWATTQNNLGTVLMSLGERETGTDLLKQAVDAYRLTLEEWTRARLPLDWATTQNNLGNALALLGGRESGTEHLDQAIAAYRLALEEWTRARVPLDWAATQNNLGNTLLKLGERETGTDRLEQAVDADQLALEVWTRAHAPLDWASAQNNLGNALSSLGERESGTDRLEQAVDAYQQALAERTRERVPLEWARTRNNLGNALLNLGQRHSGTKHLEQALVHFQDARAAMSEDGYLQYEDYFLRRIKTTTNLIETRQ